MTCRRDRRSAPITSTGAMRSGWSSFPGRQRFARPTANGRWSRVMSSASWWGRTRARAGSTTRATTPPASPFLQQARVRHHRISGQRQDWRLGPPRRVAEPRNPAQPEPRLLGRRAALWTRSGIIPERWPTLPRESERRRRLRRPISASALSRAQPDLERTLHVKAKAAVSVNSASARLTAHHGPAAAAEQRCSSEACPLTTMTLM